jgi:hypothetical protein
MSLLWRNSCRNLKVTELNMSRGSGTSEKISKKCITLDIIHWCMEAKLGVFLHSYPYLNYQKHFVSLIIASVFSPTKLEREGVGVGGSNDPNNVCTCE